MNCKSIRKFLFAFADGELDVQTSCEVLDHLKMCVACSNIVDDHQGLRRAVQRQLGSVSTPSGLEERVRRAIVRVPVLSVRQRSARWVRITAMAACVVIGFSLGWMALGWSNVDREAGGMSLARAVVPVRSHDPALLRLASAHQTRATNPMQVSDAIAGPLDQVRASITNRYGQHLALLTPDFSKQGYLFAAAEPCNGSGPDSGNGVQLVYASADHSRTLSLFCIPRQDRFDSPTMNTRGDAPRYFEVQPGGDGSMTFGVWHKDATTYLLGADLPIKPLERLVETARTGLVELK